MIHISLVKVKKITFTEDSYGIRLTLFRRVVAVSVDSEETRIQVRIVLLCYAQVT